MKYRFPAFVITVVMILSTTAFAKCKLPANEARLDLITESVRRCLHQGSTAGVLRIAYGDITSDGAADAAILIRRRDILHRDQDQVWIFESVGKELSLLTAIRFRHPKQYILSIESLGSDFRIDDGVLTFAEAVSVGKRLYPAHYRTVTYHWDGKRMVRIAASEIKPLQGHMREIG